MRIVHYVIPEFQRRYVWDKDEQWDPFWEDVRNVAEDYLENLIHTGDEHKTQEQTKPHFLGAIIIQQQLGSLREPQKIEVIDGQQRLITLQLILDAIQWVCQNYENAYFKQVAKILAEFVTNNKDLYDGQHVFKLWPSKFDRDAFKHVMDNELEVGDFKGSGIAQAHEFFQQRVTEWLQKGSDEQIERRIDALVGAITGQLQIAVIDLDMQADPHIIFETLNARGTPLAQFELIKNFVVSKTQESASDVWGDLDDEWWRKEIRQGRLYRPRLDMLFNYWLEMRNGDGISPSRVFNEFRNYAENKEIRDLMPKIILDFQNYAEYEQNCGKSYDKESFYYHMTAMQAGVITPLLFLLLSNEARIHTKTFDALESFLIRRMICRHTTKDYNRMIRELSSKLKDKLNESDMIVVKFLRAQEADARKWPSDTDVEGALVGLPLYRLLTKRRLRLVLEGVEQQMCIPEKIESGGMEKGLTIEHIMPVGWNTDNWKLSEGIDREERNTLINTIGNLTLVTQPLNSSMSNAAWAIKRAELQKHSRLMLNKELPSQPSWSEVDIRTRSSEMAKLISKRWPGPNSQKWDE